MVVPERLAAAVARLRAREHLGAARRAAAGDRGLRARGLEQPPVSSEFTRSTTLITLRGGGEEGVGEDVVYDGLDHVAVPGRRRGRCRLPGSWTLGSFAELLDELDLFPAAPVREVSRHYRRWAFESAALDLALRQAGQLAGEALGRELRPLNYVVSMRLGTFDADEPETAETLLRVLERYPSTRFKLDPTNTWTDELIAELVATGAVDSRRPQGPLQGHAGRRRHRPRAVPQAGRGVPGRLARGPGPQRRDAAGARAAPRPHHLGRADPLDRRHRGAAVPAEDGEHQAVARRRARGARRRLRLLRRARHRRLRRRPVRARRRAATTSSTWPRCSTPTRRTTSRRAGSTSRSCPTGCRRARSSSRRRRPASASPESTWPLPRSSSTAAPGRADGARAGRARGAASWATRARRWTWPSTTCGCPASRATSWRRRCATPPRAAWRCGSPTTPSTTSASSRRRRTPSRT